MKSYFGAGRTSRSGTCMSGRTNSTNWESANHTYQSATPANPTIIMECTIVTQSKGERLWWIFLFTIHMIYEVSSIGQFTWLALAATPNSRRKENLLISGSNQSIGLSSYMWQPFYKGPVYYTIDLGSEDGGCIFSHFDMGWPQHPRKKTYRSCP